MYKRFYGLEEPPFSLTPDPRFLFLSQRHREAIAALMYGVAERKGFIALTGEIGLPPLELRPQLDEVLELLVSHLDYLLAFGHVSSPRRTVHGQGSLKGFPRHQDGTLIYPKDDSTNGTKGVHRCR